MIHPPTDILTCKPPDIYKQKHTSSLGPWGWKVWGRALFTSLHTFQGLCVSTGIFVSLYLCVKEIIRAYNSSNWWQAPRHVHMITYWWVACSDRTWCHPWRGSDGCPRLWEMTLPPPKKTTPGDFYYHIRALVYWHNGHQIDMWRHIHVYSGHGVEMFGNRTHYVDGGWQTHSPELYSVESNPILRRGNDRCPKLWRMDDLQRQAPLWQSIAKKSTFIPKAVDDFVWRRWAHSPYPRKKSRLKISDPTPLKEMKSASTNPAKNGWLPGTQN